jgi:hypothetical protein
MHEFAVSSDDDSLSQGEESSVCYESDNDTDFDLEEMDQVGSVACIYTQLCA